jgi:DNA excision repair protein ERCC-4
MKLYASGGIFSITSRILVVDLLTFPNLAESITGIVVMHSEKVIATSVEAFILRIFRQKNRNGFIKAFSDIPEPFTTGFSPLANMLKNLFLRTPLLWPRSVPPGIKLIQISSRYCYFPGTTEWISPHRN